jgi:hypothetical protein
LKKPILVSSSEEIPNYFTDYTILEDKDNSLVIKVNEISNFTLGFYNPDDEDTQFSFKIGL